MPHKDPEIRRQRQRVYQKRWYEKNSEKHRASTRQYKRDNPHRVLASRYNLTLEEASYYLSIKPKHCQMPGCTATRLVFDHDHTTGKFRGWVCPRHNSVLGLLRDSPEEADNAKRYLKGERNGAAGAMHLHKVQVGLHGVHGAKGVGRGTTVQ